MEKIEIVNNNQTNCEIIFNCDVISKIENYLSLDDNSEVDFSHYFLITNTLISNLYPQILSKFQKDKVIIIKDGEKYKNFETFQYIIEKLLSAKIERKDTIVALGGGVVGDISGFCASSVLRGVNLIQIPTTLLSMCDSSIGGKTGLDTKYGKNLVGSFYSAKKVLIDFNFIQTLPEKEFKCGLGEILKYCFIEKSIGAPKDFDLMNYLDNNYQNITQKDKIEYIISAGAYLKAQVVSKDEKESNLRKILNFGHTFAHPLELLFNYKTLSHGQAVAYGIKMAFRVALLNQKIDEKYYKKAINLIDKYDLTSQKLEFKKDSEKLFLQYIKNDKKVLNHKINLILPVSNREVELFDNIKLPSFEVFAP